MPAQYQAFEAQRLQNVLREEILPWVQSRGMKGMFTAYPSWQELQKADVELPGGAEVTRKPLRSKPVRGKRLRIYGNTGIEEYRWPRDQLLSARVPKLCFVTEGPVAFQIADYVLHCSPGHGILLPPGTPFPDGRLCILDKNRMHRNACEMLMILPRQGSVSCWTSRQWFDEPAKMLQRSVSCSVPQSSVTDLLYQLINESFAQQLHWQRVGGCILEMIVSLLHRELQELPVIRTGTASSEGRTVPAANPIARVEEYINNNLQRTAHVPLTIDHMARYAYLSRTAFIKKFRENTGKTFNEYMKDRRFERACELLQGSDLSIEHISRQVGIGARSLRLLLHERTGLSPTAFRDKSRTLKRN